VSKLLKRYEIGIYVYGKKTDVFNGYSFERCEQNVNDRKFLFSEKELESHLISIAWSSSFKNIFPYIFVKKILEERDHEGCWSEDYDGFPSEYIQSYILKLGSKRNCCQKCKFLSSQTHTILDGYVGKFYFCKNKTFLSYSFLDNIVSEPKKYGCVFWVEMSLRDRVRKLFDFKILKI